MAKTSKNYRSEGNHEPKAPAYMDYAVNEMSAFRAQRKLEHPSRVKLNFDATGIVARCRDEHIQPPHLLTRAEPVRRARFATFQAFALMSVDGEHSGRGEGIAEMVRMTRLGIGVCIAAFQDGRLTSSKSSPATL